MEKHPVTEVRLSVCWTNSYISPRLFQFNPQLLFINNNWQNYKFKLLFTNIPTTSPRPTLSRRTKLYPKTPISSVDTLKHNQVSQSHTMSKSWAVRIFSKIIRWAIKDLTLRWAHLSLVAYILADTCTFQLIHIMNNNRNSITQCIEEVMKINRVRQQQCTVKIL